MLRTTIIGVSVCVLGDMASCPNFGHNKLVLFSLVLIMNFVLAFLLVSAMGSASSSLPAIFPSCPSHMYKGAILDLLQSGLQLDLSNGLIVMKKKTGFGFETPNNLPPTTLNAVTSTTLWVLAVISDIKLLMGSNLY